jgi:hypothetical protein
LLRPNADVLVSHRSKGILRAVDPSSPFVVIDESSYYFLTQDENGFALWSVTGDDEDDPILTFPPGDQGLAKAQAAFRRETTFGRWSKILLVAAIIAAPVWIVGVLIERWLELFVQHPFVGIGDSFQPQRL